MTTSIRFLIVLLGSIFFFTSSNGTVKSWNGNESKFDGLLNSHYTSSPKIKTSVNEETTLLQSANQTFIINTCLTDINKFKSLVQAASRLKKYGEVQINIGTVANKAFYEIPEGGNPWSEYASNFANLYKFYPDEKIAPFIPEEFVKANRELLLAKTKILRENGMYAAFFSNEPEIIPEPFFKAYPEYRGPRVDHPRRSNVPFFSPCLSVKGMQDIYADMMAELLQNAPEIKTFFFKTNDAGSGNCWSKWLYSGPNGPEHCKNKTTGQRINELMSSLQAGASKAGKKLDVYLSYSQGSSNFTEEERTEIQNQLPENCYFANTPEHDRISLGNNFYSTYPVKDIIDFYSFINSLKRIDRSKQQYIFINLNAGYNRADESLSADNLMFVLIADYLENKSEGESVPQILQEYCKSWGGEKYAQVLNDALVDLNKAFRFRSHNLGNLLGVYWDVSSRMINRPLVAVPQRLSAEEESYFLPYVFNVSEEEARVDYMDLHGGRVTSSPDTVKVYVVQIVDICKKLDEIDNSASGYSFIHNLSVALKIHASLIRSCGNFAAAQKIRDRNLDKLNGPIHRPAKESTWTGDPDLLKFNAVMRDELDNAEELVAVLEKEGLNQICHADDQKHEDTFLLGPDLINQLKKKCKIMLDHWRDIEDYMTTPFK